MKRFLNLCRENVKKHIVKLANAATFSEDNYEVTTDCDTFLTIMMEEDFEPDQSGSSNTRSKMT